MKIRRDLGEKNSPTDWRSWATMLHVRQEAIYG